MMEMHIPIPEGLPQALNMSELEFTQEARMLLAAKMYEIGKISVGVAAQIASLDRSMFLTMLNKYGIPAINLRDEEVRYEIDADKQTANVGRYDKVSDENMEYDIQIKYPHLLPDALQETHEQFKAEAKMAMAVKLFEMKRLSSGMAAQLAGVDRVAFLLSLHKYNVNMIDLTREELMADIDHA